MKWSVLKTGCATAAAVGAAVAAGLLDDPAHGMVKTLAATDAVACECGDRAPFVGTSRARTSLTAAEWIESQVTVAAQGRVVVKTRLTSRVPRPVAAAVAVSFVDDVGRGVAFMERTYRLGARPVEMSPAGATRTRADVVQFRLDSAVHCRVARVHLKHRRTPA